MKSFLIFRLADPIQAQQVYEAQRDLRPLHREQAEAAARQRLAPGVEDSQRQHKVRRGCHGEDINLFRKDKSRPVDPPWRSDYSVYAWLREHL